MTRADAKKTLAATWLFKPVADTVVLREVALIKAVREQEDGTPSLLRYSPATTGCVSFQRA